MTIVFVDLVGFTERSDRADPEDVRTLLVPYHATVKEILEAHGGTLDKFIGDAVMGVFGAPVAHEDDPVRAVRSAWRILQAIEELRASDPALQVRVAVNSGEAVVTHGTGPQIGEAVAGDVVNTASRMQALAPPGGVVIGEITNRLIRDDFETEQQAPAIVKGKAQPLLTWRVLGARERGAGRSAATSAGFVGREAELDLLVAARARAQREGRLHVLTVIGEPGIGKTRLVEELRRRGDGVGGPDVRHGRNDRSDGSGGSGGSGGSVGNDGHGRWLESSCAPYGETFALEPVARLIRRMAGIGPGDGADTARERLAELVQRMDGSEEAVLGRSTLMREGDWSRSRLASALGLAREPTAAGTTRPGSGDPDAVGEEEETVPVHEMADAFAEVVRWWMDGADGPAAGVLCVHDLHWAQDVLLEFLAWAARRLSDRPVLAIATGRPELDERAPLWPPPAQSATSLRLDPLRPEQTEQLVRSVLDAAGRPAPSGLPLRVGGNPLYAVEFAKMIAERGEEAAAGGALPETVQAMVAARLDALPREMRAVVQAASVAGSEFWPALVADLAGSDPAAVGNELRALAGRDVVREAASTLPGHPAYAFAHDLFREVAYARIPRVRRARLHLAAADWLAREAGDRAEERADAIAGHLLQAVDLARAAGEPALADRAASSAVGWLLSAARRAMRTDPDGALVLFERATELADPHAIERIEALVGAGLAGRRSGRLTHQQTLDRYQEALSAARQTGDPAAIGGALVRVGSQLGAIGETARSRDALNEAVGLLESTPSGRQLAAAYAYRAEDAMFAGRSEQALLDAERALAVLDGIAGGEDLLIMALHIRGDGRCSRGDRGGLADLERAVDLARRAGSMAELTTSLNYLADWGWAYDGPAAALEGYEEAIRVADLRAMVTQALWSKVGLLPLLYEVGDWDRLLQIAGEALAVGRDHLDLSLWVAAESHRARVLAARGLAAEAIERDELLAGADATEDDLQASSVALLACGALAVAEGDPETAALAMERFEALTRDAAPEFREAALADAVRTSIAAGALGVAERLVAASHSDIPHHRCNRLSALAAVAEARGDLRGAEAHYGEAAAAWTGFGVEREAAMAREGRDRCRRS